MGRCTVGYEGIDIGRETIMMSKKGSLKVITMATVVVLVNCLLCPLLSLAQQARPVFDVITINAAITPPVAQYTLAGIAAAEKSGAAGLIILLDTPGGLDTSMREMAKGILNAKVPVIVFVYPPGARAASAGVIITAAAHIAVMAPGTNIGAAHPVAIGIGGAMDKTMAQKVENDAAAYVRAIAEQRGRNADWLEKAVRKSASITAEDALRHRVIDFVAEDVPKLLAMIDKEEIMLSGGKSPVRIKSRDAILNEKVMSLRQEILTAISNPNVAYILMLLGLAGLYFEFTSPGALLPGIIGGISLLLAFFSLQTLPVNYAGVLLILFAVILFIAEIKVISHGVLSVGGIVALVLGSMLLFDSSEPAMRLSWGVLLASVATISSFFIVVAVMVVKAQKRRQYFGEEAMVGEVGEAVTDVHATGTAFIKGEYWRAYSDQLIVKGKRVSVVSVEGMILKVTAK